MRRKTSRKTIFAFNRPIGHRAGADRDRAAALRGLDLAPLLQPHAPAAVPLRRAGQLPDRPDRQRVLAGDGTDVLSAGHLAAAAIGAGSRDRAGVASSRGLRWSRRSCRLSLVLPMATTYAVVGLLGQVMFNQNFGVINQLLGGADINWIGDPTNAFVMIVFWDVWQWTPFVALVLLAGLTMVPNEVEEAAAAGNQELVDHTTLRSAAVPDPGSCRGPHLAHGRYPETLRHGVHADTRRAGCVRPKFILADDPARRLPRLRSGGWPRRRRSSCWRSPSCWRRSTSASSTRRSEAMTRIHRSHAIQLLLLAVIIVICVFPFYWMVTTSLKTQVVALQSPPRLGVHPHARELPSRAVRGWRAEHVGQFADHRGLDDGAGAGAGRARRLRAGTVRVPGEKGPVVLVHHQPDGITPSFWRCRSS